MTLTPQTASRRDSQRNRDSILYAARELFAESAAVPMYEVARRADVGQATLYRNFPDRTALVGELLGEQMQHMEQLATEHADDPNAFFILLRYVVENVARFHGITELARDDACVGSALEQLRRRLAELIKGPLRDARAAGALRRDLTVDDVFLVIRMIRGAVEEADGYAARATAATRAWALALDGLTPPGRRPADG